MLYLKQTQLERLAAEKAAQQLKTERELEAARQVGMGVPKGVGEGGDANHMQAAPGAGCGANKCMRLRGISRSQLRFRLHCSILATWHARRGPLYGRISTASSASPGGLFPP